MPHIAFKTDDLRREIEGLEIIAPPFKPMADLTVVFVMKDGALFEFMQWD
jgi:hypothetical protein